MLNQTPLLVRVIVAALVLVPLEGLIGFLDPAIAEYSPNFCIILVILLALYEQSPMGAFTVFGLGLLVDCSGPGYYLGPWAATYLSIYLLILLLPVSLLSLSVTTIIFLSFFGSFFGDLLYESLTFQSWALLGLVWLPALIRSCIVMVGAPLVCRLLCRRELRGEFTL